MSSWVNRPPSRTLSVSLLILLWVTEFFLIEISLDSVCAILSKKSAAAIYLHFLFFFICEYVAFVRVFSLG